MKHFLTKMEIKMRNYHLNKSLLIFFLLSAFIINSPAAKADIIGHYTFDNTGSGTIEQRYEYTMSPSGVVAGVNLSILNTNTTTRVDFRILDAMEPYNIFITNEFDAYGPGNNYEAKVLFIHRAAEGVESAWDKTNDTSSAVQPLNFTVTAGNEKLKITGINVKLRKLTLDYLDLYIRFQEAGSAPGPEAYYYNSQDGGDVLLDSSILFTNESKTFSIYFNSTNSTNDEKAAYNSNHMIDEITVLGYVISNGILGEFTFDNLSSYESAMGPSKLIEEIQLSRLQTNTTTRVDFAGLNNLPGHTYDSLGFGNAVHTGITYKTMFFHKATNGVETAWGKTNTSSAVQPLSFTITAGNDKIRVDGIDVNMIKNADDKEGINIRFQEADAPLGHLASSYQYYFGGVIPLENSVYLVNTSKTFTLYFETTNANDNSIIYDYFHVINKITVLGQVVPENLNVIGEYTFNDTGTGAFDERYRYAMGAIKLIPEARLSPLGTNTTTRLDFAGFANVPGEPYDGFGYGGNSGSKVIFLKRSTQNVETAWGIVPTAEATAPLNFTITAEEGSVLKIESLTITSSGGTGSSTLFSFQEAGETNGDFVVLGTGTINVDLLAPVIVETSKTFTVLMNSYVHGAAIYLDNITVNGAVVPEPFLFIIYQLLFIICWRKFNSKN